MMRSRCSGSGWRRSAAPADAGDPQDRGTGVAFGIAVTLRRMHIATVPPIAAAQLESFNPATGQRIGAVDVTSPGDVQAIVDSVAKVQPLWAQLTLEDRARYMER